MQLGRIEMLRTGFLSWIFTSHPCFPVISGDFSVFAVDMKVDQDRKNRTQQKCCDMEVMGDALQS